MKTYKTLILMLATIISMASCEKNININTVIREDGTCMREIGIPADSTILFNLDSLKAYPHVDFNNEAEVLYGLKGTNERKDYPYSEMEKTALKLELNKLNKSIKDTVMIYKRFQYQSVEEMNKAEFPVFCNGKRIKPTSSLKKIDRFFYTDYIFEETFPCLDKEFKLPITDYLSEDEASFWFTGNPNLTEGQLPCEMKDKLDDIDNRIGKWFSHCIICEAFDVIAQNYDAVQNAPMDKNAFMKSRNDFLKTCDCNNLDSLENQFRSYFRSDAYSPFVTNNNPLYSKFDERVTYIMNIVTLETPYSLVMPGKVLEAGNGKLTQNGIIRYNLSRMIPGDSVIYAKSRVINTKGFIKWGILLLLITVGIFTGIRKKTKA